jgi:hypothetical protein
MYTTVFVSQFLAVESSPEKTSAQITSVDELTLSVGENLNFSDNFQSRQEDGDQRKAYFGTSPRGRGRGGRGRGFYNRNYTGRQPFSPSMQPYMPLNTVDYETLRFYLLGQIEYYFSVENLCRDIFFRSKVS